MIEDLVRPKLSDEFTFLYNETVLNEKLGNFEYKVIVTASFLDARLKDLLDKSLEKPINSDCKLDLPLSGRINLGHQMRLYSADVCKVFHQLRSLRNDYAHQIGENSESRTARISNVLEGDSDLTSAINDVFKNDIMPQIENMKKEYSEVGYTEDEFLEVKFLTVCIMHISGLKFVEYSA